MSTISRSSTGIPLQSSGTGSFYQSTIHYPGGGSGPNDAVFVKFNYLGRKLWTTYYGGPDNDEVWSIDYQKNGDNMLAVGRATSDYTSTANFH